MTASNASCLALLGFGRGRAGVGAFRLGTGGVAFRLRVRVTAGVRPKVRAKVGAWCLQLARFVVR